MPSDPGMKYWKKTGFIATVVIVLAFPAYLARICYERSRPATDSGPFYTGRSSCIECHKKEDDLWAGSHHDLAMDMPPQQQSWGILTIMSTGITGRHTGCSGKMGNSI